VTRDPMPRWLLALLCLGAFVILAPFAPWVVLGVWLGLYAERVYQPMIRVFNGRRGLSATVTVLLLVVFVLPIAAMIGSLVIDAIALVQRLLDTSAGQSILERLARGDATPGTDATTQALTSSEGIVDLLREQGGRALQVFSQVAGAAAHVVIGLLIMVSGIYGSSSRDGPGTRGPSGTPPIPADALNRFAAAFVETGRGLAYGMVGAGLLAGDRRDDRVPRARRSVRARARHADADLLRDPRDRHRDRVGPGRGGARADRSRGAALALGTRRPRGDGTIDNLARPLLTRRGQLQLRPT